MGRGIHFAVPTAQRAGCSPRLRPCGCKTLRPHQAEPHARLQMRPVLRLLVSRTYISEQICSQVSSAAWPEEEELASGSWAHSGPGDEGLLRTGGGTPTPPLPHLVLPLSQADLRSHRAASPGWASGVRLGAGPCLGLSPAPQGPSTSPGREAKLRPHSPFQP